MERFLVKFVECLAQRLAKDRHIEYVAKRLLVGKLVKEQQRLPGAQLRGELLGIAVGGAQILRFVKDASDGREDSHIVIIMKHFIRLRKSVFQKAYGILRRIFRQGKDHGPIAKIQRDDLTGKKFAHNAVEHLQRAVVERELTGVVHIGIAGCHQLKVRRRVARRIQRNLKLL